MIETITVDKKKRDYLLDFWKWYNMLPQLNELKQSGNIFGPGVYFLFLGDTLQYIGTAQCIVKRIGFHFGSKQFDDIEIINTINHIKLEEELIKKYNPPLNKTYLKNSKRKEIKRREIEELVITDN